MDHFEKNAHLCIQNGCECSMQDLHQFHDTSAAIFWGICKAVEKNDHGVIMSVSVSAWKNVTPIAQIFINFICGSSAKICFLFQVWSKSDDSNTLCMKTCLSNSERLCSLCGMSRG